MQSRVCFDVTDINYMVFTMPQAEILNEIHVAATVLSGALPEGAKFYWQDRLDAYKLALYIAEWAGKDIIAPILTISALNASLRQKLYAQVTTKATVRGGVKYG